MWCIIPQYYLFARRKCVKPYYDHKGITIYRGDCLEVMPDIPDGLFDMVMADPPYGITACKWDSIIPIKPMWKELKRLVRPSGVIVMTASQPFTTTLISSNMEMFRYCWVWEKTKAGNFQQAKNSPLKKHEDVAVFFAWGGRSCSADK
jgi:site-specific DNA-methyltransferase (adenine-specific)